MSIGGFISIAVQFLFKLCGKQFRSPKHAIRWTLFAILILAVSLPLTKWLTGWHNLYSASTYEYNLALKQVESCDGIDGSVDTRRTFSDVCRRADMVLASWPLAVSIKQRIATTYLCVEMPCSELFLYIYRDWWARIIVLLVTLSIVLYMFRGINASWKHGRIFFDDMVHTIYNKRRHANVPSECHNEVYDVYFQDNNKYYRRLPSAPSSPMYNPNIREVATEDGHVVPSDDQHYDSTQVVHRKTHTGSHNNIATDDFQLSAEVGNLRDDRGSYPDQTLDHENCTIAHAQYSSPTYVDEGEGVV